MITRTLLAAAATSLLLGPPRIAVQATDLPADALAMITADYHTDEAEARVYGTLYRVEQGRRVDRPVALEKLSAHRYRLPRAGLGTEAVVVVVGVEQGENGKHGAAEALLRVARGGRVVGVDIPTERDGRHHLPRRITAREITAALEQVAAGTAD